MTETIGYTIDRVFAAPRDLVYSMFITPEHFSVWWGGNDVEVPLDSIEMDVRNGGSWKGTMVGPGNEWTINWGGEFREIDAPNHLVMAFTDDLSSPERDWFDVTFTHVDGGTRVVLSQLGGHLTPEQYEQTRVGTDSFLDAMETYLERLQQN